MRFRAIIFDLDGVLVESELLWEQADRIFAHTHGVAVTDDIIASFKGRRQSEIISEYRTKLGLTGETNVLERERSEIVKTVLQQWAKPVPGAMDFLVYLQAQQSDLHRALASSSPHDVIAFELDHFSLSRFFSLVVSGEDVPQGKPAPDIFLRVAEKLVVEPGDCLVIEDSASGILAAKNAGMVCVALAKPYVASADAVRADRVVSGYIELTPDFLDAL